MKELLFADCTVLVLDSEEKLSSLIMKFGRVCDRRKLKVNLEGKVEHGNLASVRNSNLFRVRRESEEVSKFIYLG